MASSSTPSSSTPSSSSPLIPRSYESIVPSLLKAIRESWKHEVFLSFRGEDTRKTFVNHLYTILVQQGIRIYKDDETLTRGESIRTSLLKGIRESRIAVIVFSENYANSSWCLDELTYIMECKTTRGQIVFPVFYDVDPSDVRNQEGKFGEAFRKHKLENKHSVKLWKNALAAAGSLSGWVTKDYANGSGRFFAVKEVSLLDQGSQGNPSKVQLEQEISLLRQFHHKNIVRYLGTDSDDGKLYIFLELVTKGSLAKLYKEYELQDSQVSAYTRQIMSGLNYLHERNVVHRDIKCANILVDASGSVKLADFGLAKMTTLNDIKSCKGTAHWMAPEVVNNQAEKGYGLAVDIWSLGCTVLEMLTRKIPYYHLEWKQAPFRIGRGELPEIPNTLSAEAQDFILKCLQVDPNDRPTAAQLLEHPFLKRPTSMNSALPSPHHNSPQL